MRPQVLLASLITTSVCHGGVLDYDPMKPAAEVRNDDMLMVEGPAMQQWFNHIQPQIKEWAKCDYALLSSDKYGPDVSLNVKQRLRDDVQRLLPSVASGAKAYQLEVEYAKWFHTWRGFHQGLSTGSDVALKDIADAWANDCAKQYGG